MPGYENLWFNKVEALNRQAEDLVKQNLRVAGWVHTSQTIGSYWRWCKCIKGVHYTVNTVEAACIQEYLDRKEYFRQYPEELGD